MVTRLPPEPVRRPASRQAWTDFTALHWPFPPDVVQSLLPPGLHVDTFEGQAWVSVTPFRMQGVRLEGLPALPGASDFGEMNVRTYVVDRHRRDGLWFLSLEAERLPFVLAVRTFLSLPYCWSRVDVATDGRTASYACTRRWPGAGPRATVSVVTGTERDASDLDVFLTARWRGFTRLPVGLAYVPIEHRPWPLHDAEVVQLEETFLAADGLSSPGEPALVHFSPGVDVRLGRPQLVKG